MNAEYAFNNYKNWVVRKNILYVQLKNFVGITEREYIESLTFFQPQDERVQTSGISDKTSKIALNYKDKLKNENEDLLKYLSEEYRLICREMDFLEYGISTLSGYMPSLINDMVVKGMKWDELMAKYHISHSMVAKYRRKAIKELDVLYSERNRLDIEYMLS
ncbi:MAG: hypothetical protein Q4D26_11135 [Clostridia bacterium]|nr:hypothetical protein [Clostridia bacterium]